MSEYTTVNLTVDLVSISAICAIEGHDFDDQGLCRLMAANLLAKGLPPVQCGGTHEL